ncbi:MAG: hypothetical protein JJU36_13590 [Phycisphaeraceae bacterium]|nr:hypothetical protein [Phycisphaeraceae bacterium]
MIRTASFLGLADPANRGMTERFEAYQAGGGGMVRRRVIVANDADCRMAGDSAEFSFEHSDSSFEALVEVWDLPANWKAYRTMRLVLETLDHGMVLELVIVGARNRLIERLDLPPGERRTVEVDLLDLPLTAGIRAAYEPTAVRLAALWNGDEHLSDFERARRKWKSPEPFLPEVPPAASGPRRLRLHRLELVPATGEPPFRVDRFGQRVNADWPGKVRGEEDLIRRRDDERAHLETLDEPPDRDRFGGWTGGPKFEATGFFRTHNNDGVWWLVDPLGHPFFSIGTTGVRSTDNTVPIGREELYEIVPPREGPGSEAWVMGTPGNMWGVGFYRWNILRKYGNHEAWRDRVCLRFRKWGFNTFANWSEPIALQQELIPHARTTTSRDERFPLIHRAFADVFDPKWLELLDAKFAEEVAPHRDNPWVIGYFVDNESPWRNMRLLEAGRDMAIRGEWRRFCHDRFGGDLRALGKALGRDLASWEEVASLGQANIADEGPAAELMKAFEAHYAATMFKGVRQTLLKHDPNHLYLGCRFVRAMPDRSIVAAQGAEADVLSINCYDVYPRPEQFDGWYEAGGGKPLMIGEHHFPLRSVRQLPPLYPAFTADERRLLYVNFLHRWASRPYAVGSHWFQHADQAATGRGSDGENQTVGFVDVTDQPHAELVSAAREVATKIYAWHHESRA